MKMLNIPQASTQAAYDAALEKYNHPFGRKFCLSNTPVEIIHSETLTAK
jgi:hypothetical protein